MDDRNCQLDWSLKYTVAREKTWLWSPLYQVHLSKDAGLNITTGRSSLLSDNASHYFSLY